jgi:hypothetical protein
VFEDAMEMYVLGGLEDEEDASDECILYSREREVKKQPPRRCD